MGEKGREKGRQNSVRSRFSALRSVTMTGGSGVGLKRFVKTALALPAYSGLDDRTGKNYLAVGGGRSRISGDVLETIPLDFQSAGDMVYDLNKRAGKDFAAVALTGDGEIKSHPKTGGGTDGALFLINKGGSIGHYVCTVVNKKNGGKRVFRSLRR